MKKVLFLIITMFMLSGCSLKYEVDIDDDRSVTDNISITVPSALSSTYFDTPREYLEYMYEVKTEEYDVTGYSKNFEIGSDFSTVNMSKTYNSVESYLNSGVIRRMYSDVSVTIDGGKTIVKLSGMNDIFASLNNYDSSYGVEPFSIVLNSKYAIENDNSDQRNVMTGTYIWNFDPKTFGKSIEFTVTDRINTVAVINDKYSVALLAIVLLAILTIVYIIYAVLKKKAAEVNSI